MFRFCIALLFSLWSGIAAYADSWTFHYGPDHGQKPELSYAQIIVGGNRLRLEPFNGGRDIIIGALVNRFETNGATARNLNAGQQLAIRVWFGDKDYQRNISKSQYALDDIPDKDVTVVYFLATADDLLAMADGKAVFINAGSMQFRYPLDEATPALRGLLNAMKEIES